MHQKGKICMCVRERIDKRKTTEKTEREDREE